MNVHAGGTNVKRKPRLLDLFCGAGGAAMGYSRAGFEVVGVDIKPQPHYPFEFHQADALEYVAEHGREFDAIHASPPCQAYAITNNIWKKRDAYPMLIEPTRDLLVASGLPYVIENVPGAPLIDPVILCGDMFGLRVIRHRLFESSVFMLHPVHVKHTARASYGRTPKNGEHFTISGHFGDVAGGRKAMGIDWMTRDELAQAIPPAYTEWIGAQLIAAPEVSACH
jgi:DNA (cytosine-5)-methyltransferase 1